MEDQVTEVAQSNQRCSCLGGPWDETLRSKPRQGAGPKPDTMGTVSQDASHNTAKCKYCKMLILHEKPHAASHWSAWVGVPGTASSGGTMSRYRAMWAWTLSYVSSWALGMLLLVLFWVPQFGAGFGNPSNTLCRNRLFLLVCLRYFPFLVHMAAPQEHGTCLDISNPFRTGRQESLFPFSNKTLGQLTLGQPLQLIQVSSNWSIS